MLTEPLPYRNTVLSRKTIVLFILAFVYKKYKKSPVERGKNY